MERLIDEFHPTHLYAYDPHPVLELPPLDGTIVELVRAAAWTHTGTVGYVEHDVWSYLTDTPDAPQVRCVDLAKELWRLKRKHKDSLVLKLDCEGAEYMLLPHLVARGADRFLDVLWVEWHPYEHPYAMTDHARIRAEVEASVRCEMRVWVY